MCIGSGIGGLPLIEETHDAYLQRRRRARSRRSSFRASIINMIAGRASIKYGFNGPNLGIGQRLHHRQSQHRRGGAADRVRRRRHDGRRRRRSGDVAARRGRLRARRARCRRATTIRQTRQPALGRRTATGSCWARAPACMVLEEYEHARARGATIYCEIAGYGMSADAHHITAPPEDGDGAARDACRTRCATPASQPTDVDYINAHGTSTPARRRGRDHRDEAGVRRARVAAGRDLHQVDDRPPAGRCRRGSRRCSPCSRSATRSRRRR